MKLAELGNSILESRSGGEAKQVPARSCRYYTRFPSGRWFPVPTLVSPFAWALRRRDWIRKGEAETSEASI